MPSIRRILVAVKNPRQKNCPATAKAAVLARALGARLELFHAISEPVAFDAFSAEAMEKHQQTQHARHLTRLEAIATGLRKSGIKVSTAVEWDHPPHEALVRHARRVRADLIVAQRHAGEHVARWLLRYTDWELLRQSPVPVLLVKKPRPWQRPAILAAVDPTHAFDKTARLDHAILQLGTDVTTATRGALHVLHAYSPTPLGLSAADLRASDASQRIARHSAQQAGARLEKTLRTARLGKLAKDRRHLIPLHPADAIPLLAKQQRCDIVIMGALARSGLKRLLVGNTAERILDELPCDLLIVKPPGFATSVPARGRGPELYFASPPAAIP